MSRCLKSHNSSSKSSKCCSRMSCVLTPPICITQGHIVSSVACAHGATMTIVHKQGCYTSLQNCKYYHYHYHQHFSCDKYYRHHEMIKPVKPSPETLLRTRCSHAIQIHEPCCCGMVVTLLMPPAQNAMSTYVTCSWMNIVEGQAARPTTPT